MCILLNTHTYIVTIVLEGLYDNIGLVGVSAKWSYVTASTSHHDQAIPILSPLLFMHVGHPYIPLFKIRRIFDLLVIYVSSVSPDTVSRFYAFLFTGFFTFSLVIHLWDGFT